VPTIRFQVFYVFLVLTHDWHRVVHSNVTANSTAEWTAQQLREVFPFDQIPRYLLRDRDGIFGTDFRRQVKDMKIPSVPWHGATIETKRSWPGSRGTPMSYGCSADRPKRDRRELGIHGATGMRAERIGTGSSAQYSERC
jgi:hypothetical protein